MQNYKLVNVLAPKAISLDLKQSGGKFPHKGQWPHLTHVYTPRKMFGAMWALNKCLFNRRLQKKYENYVSNVHLPFHRHVFRVYRT